MDNFTPFPLYRKRIWLWIGPRDSITKYCGMYRMAQKPTDARINMLKIEGQVTNLYMCLVGSGSNSDIRENQVSQGLVGRTLA
jgi:hypothetical protein